MHLFFLPVILLGCTGLAYLIGSIPSGYILGRMYGLGDIRTLGSGNIGATNMLRTGNRNLAAATLACDMLKGFIAPLLCSALLILLMKKFFPTTGNVHFSLEHTEYFFGLCAVVGHVWPVWLDYKGGKGVATSFGAFLACVPLVGIACIMCWLAVFFLKRYSSLAALVSISLAPVLGAFLVNPQFAETALLIAIIVILKHRENIARLKAGTETKWSKSGEPA